MDFGLPVNEFEAYFGDTYEWMSEWINRLSVCVLFYRPKICNHPESRPCIISILNNIENLTSYGIWNRDFMLYNMTGLYNKWRYRRLKETVYVILEYGIIYLSRKIAFWSILLYIFLNFFLNVGYDFLKLMGAKHPGGRGWNHWWV